MKCLPSSGARRVAALVAAGIACSSPSTAPPAPSCSLRADAKGPYDVVIATTDYSSSEVGLASVGGASAFAGGVDLGADPALASSAGRYFWIARASGTVIELDTTTLAARATFDANEPGRDASTDPYDVAVAPDGSLWVARFEVPSILVLNCDGTRRRTIDLSGLDPVDGNPNMSSIRILDPTGGPAPGSMTTSKAYVSLGVLDDHDVLRSTRPSKLARVDLETGAVEDVLTLAGRNPLTTVVLGERLYLADAGTWCCAPGTSGCSNGCPSGQRDAGIEVVDAASFTSELVLSGAELGGHVTELAVTAGCGAAIVAGALPSTPTSLVEFDPTGAPGTAAHRAILPMTPSFTLAGITWVRGDVLLVGDNDGGGTAPRVRVFDADTSTGCAIAERATSLPLVLPAVGLAPLR